MKDSLWSALRNPFENVTRNSFKTMNLIATDHHDKLKAAAAQNSDLSAMYGLYEPTYIQFQEAFTATTTNLGKYRASTKRVETIFDEITSSKIRHWDVAIQYHYPSETWEYTELMPNGKEPFQKGGYEMRIKELKSLSERMEDYAPLRATRAEIDQYVGDLIAARTRQQGLEMRKKQLSGKLEDARRELSIALHGVLAYLTFYYRNDLAVVEQFYELQYLRSEAKPSKAGEEEDTAKDDESNLDANNAAIDELENDSNDGE
jgi:hypothetical protein